MGSYQIVLQVSNLDGSSPGTTSSSSFCFSSICATRSFFGGTGLGAILKGLLKSGRANASWKKLSLKASPETILS